MHVKAIFIHFYVYNLSVNKLTCNLIIAKQTNTQFKFQTADKLIICKMTTRIVFGDLTNIPNNTNIDNPGISITKWFGLCISM